MIRYQLNISPAAQKDLKNLYCSGLQRWGKLQTVNYLDNLKNRLWALTQYPLIGIERPELQPGTRSIPLESHIVFYRIQSKNIEIIRILHTRQDPCLHIE